MASSASPYLEELDDFGRRSAQQLYLETAEQAVELDQWDVTSCKLIVRDNASLSVPTSALLMAEASDLAPSALS